MRYAFLLTLLLLAPPLLASCGGADAPEAEATAPEAEATAPDADVAVTPRSEEGDAPAASVGQETPSPAPELTLTTTDGETIDLSAPGAVVVLNFWATWCGPCRIEIPDLKALHDEMGAEGVTVVGVAVGEGEDEVAPFAEQMAINYPMVLDADRAVSEAFGGVYGLPTTVVIDRQGRVVRRILGLFPVDQMKPQLAALAAKS